MAGKKQTPERTAAKRSPPISANRKTQSRRAGKTEKAKATGISTAGHAKVPFPRKNQRPTEAEFLARLPLATGKKFEAVRTFMKKQKGVAEDLYYYGPKTGWAFRYLRDAHSLATVMIHDGHLTGIVALDAQTLTGVDFASLSQVGQGARKLAHGSPSLLWLDLPLDGHGATDFKLLLKAKLKALLSAAPPAPLPTRQASPAPSRQPPPPPPRRAQGPKSRD